SWGHIQPFWYYIVEVIPLFWLPLSLFIPWLFKPFKQAFQDKELRVIYPLVMLFFVVLFFSLSKGKRAEYLLPVLPMLALAIAPYFEMLIKKKGIQKLIIIVVALLSLVFAIIGLAGIFEVEKVSRLTAKYFVNPWYWMATFGVFGLVVTAIFNHQAIKLFSIFIMGLWLSYSLWAVPMVNKAMSTEPMMSAIAKFVPENAELGIVGFREKLLLHTQWKTTHFGYHHPKAEQQQAAINWIKQKPNRYLLVSSRYLNDCFKTEISIDYDSFHKSKWLLFDKNKLTQSSCAADGKDYSMFFTKL
ncbi:Polymyxin resistance protein ArnT, undecaprenyl phosphate-alpha-L-Ara4N transferase; Melittin resistance protein PqaB, partial [hydrothermal vent metagenome]